MTKTKRPLALLFTAVLSAVMLVSTLIVPAMPVLSPQSTSLA